MVNITSAHMPLVRASGVVNPIINVTYVYSSTGGTACLMTNDGIHNLLTGSGNTYLGTMQAITNSLQSLGL